MSGPEADPSSGGGSQAPPPARKRWRYLVLAILIVLLGAGAALSAKPVYRWVRDRQGAKLAAEALVEIEAEEWKKASSILREANRLAPREPEVIRALARFFAFVDLKQQRLQLEKLYRRGDHNDEDLRELIRLELRFGNVPKAKVLTEVMLRGESGSDIENLKAGVEVARVIGDRSRSEALLRKIVEIDPSDHASEFELGKSMIESSFSENNAAGWDVLYRLAQTPDETGLEALRVIVRKPAFYQSRIEEIQELTKKNPNAGENDHVAALGWRYELTSSDEERRVLLEDSIREREGRTHHENRSFYFWLNAIGQQDRVLELLPKEVAYEAPRLLTVYITALLQSSKYDEIRELMALQDELEESSEVSFIKAQCAAYLDLPTAEKRRHLQDSYELALLDKRTQMFGHVAQLAEKQGMRDLAETVYEAMANVPEVSLTGYSNLLEYAKRRKDLKAMRTLTREIREKVPENPFAIKLATYLELLYGNDIEGSWETIRQLAERVPNDPECEIIQAFARYRFGDLEQAKEFSSRCDVDELSPSYRAIYAVIRGACGDSLEAVAIAEALPQSLLLKEELELVRPWIP